ncbi:carbonate dehydratase [Dyadobacter psychrotolerans]|uniref:Carbonic anhydrase 2 n=1 Tax=Dyadobacter psychrotolerans TaxID=2541721 RepID=A0A4R5DZ55_9BACT|nr:carbonate dehydratase [Dyadobacter psychrotolerans]TDE16715.1 carbonate dehydratase [Dyadobacter psychrotolerans]
MIKTYQNLFQNNKRWVSNTLKEDPEFFNNLAQGQSPQFLWIGCSDSRVPANEITGTVPGDIFVHRNIANMVVHTDMSMLSVLDYSINVLGVKHVMVVGHYGCGGVKAAMGNKQVGLIDNWLRNIKDVYRLHALELNAIEDPHARSNRLVELNVQEQVFNLTKTSIVQNAWANGKDLLVHGIVYDVNDGMLRDMDITVGDGSKMDSVYKFELEKILHD